MTTTGTDSGHGSPSAAEPRDDNIPSSHSRDCTDHEQCTLNPSEVVDLNVSGSDVFNMADMYPTCPLTAGPRHCVECQKILLCSLSKHSDRPAKSMTS